MYPDENLPEVENNDIDYINAINELKQNTVSKDQYDKLRAENKQLLDTLVNGGQLTQHPLAEKADIAALRQGLFERHDLTNLEYCKRTLELRNALIEDGQQDPFLPVGSNVRIEDSDYVIAERVAGVMQECVDEANGDSALFTALLQNRLQESGRR